MYRKVHGQYLGHTVDFEVRGATINSPPSWWAVPRDSNEPAFPVSTMEVRTALEGREVVFEESETLIQETITALQQAAQNINMEDLSPAQLSRLEDLVTTLRTNYYDGRRPDVPLDPPAEPGVVGITSRGEDWTPDEG